MKTVSQKRAVIIIVAIVTLHNNALHPSQKVMTSRYQFLTINSFIGTCTFHSYTTKQNLSRVPKATSTTVWAGIYRRRLKHLSRERQPFLKPCPHVATKQQLHTASRSSHSSRQAVGSSKSQHLATSAQCGSIATSPIHLHYCAP